MQIWISNHIYVLEAAKHRVVKTPHSKLKQVKYKSEIRKSVALLGHPLFNLSRKKPEMVAVFAPERQHMTQV